jgi:hypothetical protein
MRRTRPQCSRKAAFARAFPAYAGLSDDQLLELIEETSTALALSARGEDTAAEALFTATAIRLGIADEVDRLADSLLTLKEGNR